MNFDIEDDLWSMLARTGKKIVMYGMGNGADKILAVCAEHGIEVCDFFASDGFVRGHAFHGKTVLTYAQIKEKYGADNIIVLLSFASSLPDVLSNIYRISSECELYAPDVPVTGKELFNAAFFASHKREAEAVYGILADDISRRIFQNVILYKLSGQTDYLKAAETDKSETYKLLRASEIEYAADLGAYNGDTVRELGKFAPKLKKVHAFEPDKRSFAKLSAYASSEDSFEVLPLNIAAWSCSDTLTFDASGNRNSNAFSSTGKTVSVNAASLDSVVGNGRVDYIKFDVEGAEREALIGCNNIISSRHPSLLISAYHRSEDIFTLPLIVSSLFPSYSLYLRRSPYIPAWDLNLICV